MSYDTLVFHDCLQGLQVPAYLHHAAKAIAKAGSTLSPSTICLLFVSLHLSPPLSSSSFSHNFHSSPTHTFPHSVVHNTLVSSSSHSYFLAARPSALATTDCSCRSTSLCPSVTQQTSSPCLPAVQVTTATAPPLKCATSARSRRTARALVRELTGVNTSTIATLASFRFFSYQERSVTK